MRILFFGDGAWATNSLKRLVRAGFTLVGVVLRLKPTDSALRGSTNELQLPILQPQNVNEPQFVQKVKDLRPDLNLSVSYDQILQRQILQTAPQGFINFHAGKLPYYRGRNVINWAILNGETEIGLTAHYVDEGIDTGDIILQRTLPIHWTDSYGDMLRKVTAAFPDLVLDTVRLINDHKVKTRQQRHLEGTYFAARQQGDEWLDWCDCSGNLYNKIRSITHPGPGARTMFCDRTLIVWRARYDPDWPKYIGTPGEVVGVVQGEGVKVKTGDSTLILEKVQFEGENEREHVPVFRIGDRLGINLVETINRLRTEMEELRTIIKGWTIQKQ